MPKAAGFVNYGTDLDNPDFAGIARAVGVLGSTVEKADELDVALQGSGVICPGSTVMTAVSRSRLLLIVGLMLGPYAVSLLCIGVAAGCDHAATRWL